VGDGEGSLITYTVAEIMKEFGMSTQSGGQNWKQAIIGYVPRDADWSSVLITSQSNKIDEQSVSRSQAFQIEPHIFVNSFKLKITHTCFAKCL